MSKSKNHLAIEKIGRFFGAVTPHATAASMLSYSQFEGLPIATADIPGDTIGAENPIVMTLMEVTEGGKLSKDVLHDYPTLRDDAGGAGLAEADLRKMIRLVYDGFDDSSGPDAPFLHDKSKLDDQGCCLPDGMTVYSINRMLGIPSSDATEDNAPSVNSSPSSPDKSKPAMSVYQIFPVNLNISNRDTGAISVFLNCVPSLEMSRCVPVIDLQVISAGAPVADDVQNSYGRIQNISLGQFLLGNAAVKMGTANYTMAASVDSEALQNWKDGQSTENASGDTAQSPDSSANAAHPGVASAGMEMFTSPQTLVMGDEVHYEYDDPQWEDFNTRIEGEQYGGDQEGKRLTAGGKRAAPVLDRFRPFMTLGDLSINVAPSTGMMAYKSANLKITLHDRSRLAEIAPLVKPDMFGSVQLLIEYGWAHPDQAIHSSGPTPDGVGSPFGWFLGTLRCREKYQVVNSSFSFTEDGQVEIDLKLAMMGGNDMHTVNIGRGGDVDEAVDVINQLTSAIALLKRKITGSGGGSTSVKGFDFLADASSTSRAVSLPKETRVKIRRFIQGNRRASASSDIGALRDNLVELYGSNVNGREGSLADLQSTIQNEVQRKMSLLKTTEDPWLRDLDTNSIDILRSRENRGGGYRKYVSLGKIFSIFLGLPIASTGKYDEVQFVYYCFNSKASYMKDYNIAQFPIAIDDFQTTFAEVTKTTANPSIRKFVSFINSTFLGYLGSPGYGMTKIYTKRDPEDYRKAIVARTFKDKETKLFNAKQSILNNAYGEEGTHHFKKPVVQVRVECVPASGASQAPGGADQSEEGGQPAGNERSILRIHVYDSQATTYETVAAMLEASTKESIGVLSRDAAKVRGEDGGNSEHNKMFTDHVTAAIKDQILEALPINAGASAGTINVEEFPAPKYRLKGGFPALKSWISRTMPTIIYGGAASGVTKASLKSMNNPQLATINMQRQGFGGPQDPQGSRDTGVPMRISPTMLELETIGCPLFNFGQQFFVDFGTGTSADNIYAVTGIDHKVGPGSFTTSVKMIQLDTYGKYEGMLGNIQNALTVIADHDAQS
jgi:hypothetical protein